MKSFNLFTYLNKEFLNIKSIVNKEFSSVIYTIAKFGYKHTIKEQVYLLFHPIKHLKKVFPIKSDSPNKIYNAMTPLSSGSLLVDMIKVFTTKKNSHTAVHSLQKMHEGEDIYKFLNDYININQQVQNSFMSREEVLSNQLSNDIIIITSNHLDVFSKSILLTIEKREYA